MDEQHDGNLLDTFFGILIGSTLGSLIGFIIAQVVLRFIM